MKKNIKKKSKLKNKKVKKFIYLGLLSLSLYLVKDNRFNIISKNNDLVEETKDNSELGNLTAGFSKDIFKNQEKLDNNLLSAGFSSALFENKDNNYSIIPNEVLAVSASYEAENYNENELDNKKSDNSEIANNDNNMISEPTNDITSESNTNIENYDDFVYPTNNFDETLEEYYQDKYTNLYNDRNETLNPYYVYEDAPTIEETFDRFLSIYAEYFHFDPEKVVSFARWITNNYTYSFENINGTSDYDVNDPEATALVFCHQLYRDELGVDLNGLGYSLNDFKTNKDIETINDDLILSSGLSYSEFLGRVCNMLGQDETYILGISYHETGYITSKNARTKNNFGGLKGKNGFFTYPTPEAGIIAMCRNLKKYEKYNLKSVEELSRVYVYGPYSEKGIYDSAWSKNVKKFHKEFNDNYSNYFLQDNYSSHKNTSLGLYRR